MVNESKVAAGRTFVRSQNNLIKIARMYGFDHSRSAAQCKTAWSELQAILPADPNELFLLGVSEGKLLLDGVPVESTPAERAFGDLLSASGLASLGFSSRITPQEFGEFVKVVAAVGTKPASLVAHLKAAFGEKGSPGIRINEIRFVAEEAEGSSVAAHLVVKTMDPQKSQMQQFLNDPEKLLQMIIAAEGMESGATGGAGSAGPAGAPGTGVGGFGPGTGFVPGGTGESGGGFAGARTGGEGGGGSYYAAGPAGDEIIRGASGLPSDYVPAGSGAMPAGASPGGTAGGGSAAGTGGMGTGSAGSSGGAGFPAGASPAGSAAMPGGTATGGFYAGDAAGGLPGAGLAGAAAGAGPFAAGGRAGEASGFGPAWRTLEFRTARALDVCCEEDIVRVVRLLAGIHGATQPGTPGPDPAAVKRDFDEMPLNAKDLLRQSLASLPSGAVGQKTDTQMLIKLAENLAIRYALKRFERGEVKVNAVRQMLDRMSGEIDNLKKILTAYEEKMSKAGIYYESHADLLDRQFWAAVPESGKRAVLTSEEAYCVPPRNVKQYVTELLDRGSAGAAADILLSYARCVSHLAVDARRKAAIGMSELAELYARAAGELLNTAIKLVGQQVCEETVPEVESLLSAAFVRLSQEAASRRNFSGMKNALDTVTHVERLRPAVAQSLRPRIGVENRLPDFIEEAVRGKEVNPGLVEVMRRVPRAAVEQLMGRFNRAERREECSRVFELVSALGQDAAEHLRHILRDRPPAEAAATVGLMSLLDMPALEELLPVKLREWERPQHDLLVREVASAGSPERGRLLGGLLERLDPLVWSQAIDELGMSGDRRAAQVLLPLAAGELSDKSESYVRVKAIEALGRLGFAAAAPVLRAVVEARNIWRWASPHELRVVAAQSLIVIDPEWARDFLPRSALTPDELALGPLAPSHDSPWLRQRRYLRVSLPRSMSAAAETSHGEYRLSTQLLSLGGGMAACESKLAAGTQASLKLSSGLRPLRARVLMRKAGPQLAGFEIVDMELEDRGRLRKLLSGFGRLPGALHLDASHRNAAA
jgi:hypothetical protein